METNRLKQFCLIVESGSLTKAADLFYISHSGLSKSMKILQEDLGCALLRPSGRGVSVTEDGFDIYKKAKQFLAQEEQLFSKQPNFQQEDLKIGTVEIFLLAQCGQLKQKDLDEYNITLLDLSPGEIEQQVATKQIDYGISYAPYPMDNIDLIEVGTYKLGCYCRKGKLSKQDISEIPFAVPAQGLTNNPLGIKERDGWLEAITPRNRKYSVNLLSTGLELVRQGLCAIYIPKFVGRNYPELVEIPIPKIQNTTQCAYLIKHKDRPEDKMFKRLRKVMKSVLKT